MFCDQGVRPKSLENHERGIEHAPLLKVGNEAGDRFIDRETTLFVGFHIHVGIPAFVAAAAITELNIADAFFHQTPRHQKLTPEIVRLFLADSVEIEHILRLVREIHHLGRGQLHPRRQFVRLHPAGDVRVDRVNVAKFLVEPLSVCICSSRSAALPPFGGYRFGIGVSPAWNGVAAALAPRYPPVNCTGDDGRPMLTNVGRFLFALPSA